MERLHQLSTVREETVVQIDESNETTELMLCLRLWKVVDGLDFLWNRRNFMAVNVVSQEVE